MKITTYALSILALLNMSLSADEWKTIDDVNTPDSVQEIEATPVYTPPPKKVQQNTFEATPQQQKKTPLKAVEKEESTVVLQLGFINLSFLPSGTTTYDVTDDSGNTVASDVPLGDEESGFEISFISGVERDGFFDGRVGITFQSVDVYSRSTMSLLGEYILAFNISKYATPYIGVNGGLAYLQDNDSNLGFQFGAYAGITGEIVVGIGYYAEIGKSMKGFSKTYGSSDYFIVEYSTPVTIGVNYTF